MLNHKNCLVFIIVLVLAGCAGSKPPVNKKDVPDWYLIPPKIEGKFVGIGDAQRPDINLSKNVATTRAQGDISRQVSSKIKEIIRDYAQASGKGDDAAYIEFNERVSKVVASSTLDGCVVDKMDVINGRVFALVTYDISAVQAYGKETVRKEAKKEEALYNEFKARQAFEALDKEFGKINSNN